MNAGKPLGFGAATTVADDGGERADHTLGLLDAVEQEDAVSQRRLAKELGVALGLANALIKRCATKGLIKVKQAPAGRYAYYLTPKGFAEKARLTAKYLRDSLSFFRRAREETAELMNQARARGWRRIALAGAGELAEIASLAAHDVDISIAGIVDARDNRAKLAGLRIVADAAALGPIDGIMITDVRTPHDAYARCVAAFGEDRVLAPRLLRLGKNGNGGRR